MIHISHQSINKLLRHTYPPECHWNALMFARSEPWQCGSLTANTIEMNMNGRNEIKFNRFDRPIVFMCSSSMLNDNARKSRQNDFKLTSNSKDFPFQWRIRRQRDIWTVLRTLNGGVFVVAKHVTIANGPHFAWPFRWWPLSGGRFLRRKVSTQRVINWMKLEQVYIDISQKQIIRREMLYYIWIVSYV